MKHPQEYKNTTTLLHLGSTEKLIAYEAQLPDTTLRTVLDGCLLELAETLKIPLNLECIENMYALLNEDIILIGYIDIREMFYSLLMCVEITREETRLAPIEIMETFYDVYEAMFPKINYARRLYAKSIQRENNNPQ